MKSLRRWNVGLALAVILGAITLTAEPASARVLMCGSDACADDCAYECDGACVKACFTEKCYGTEQQTFSKRQMCITPT